MKSANASYEEYIAQKASEGREDVRHGRLILNEEVEAEALEHIRDLERGFRLAARSNEPKYTLDQLLEGFSSNDGREEVDWGGVEGNETL